MRFWWKLYIPFISLTKEGEKENTENQRSKNGIVLIILDQRFCKWFACKPEIWKDINFNDFILDLFPARGLFSNDMLSTGKSMPLEYGIWNLSLHSAHCEFNHIYTHREMRGCDGAFHFITCLSKYNLNSYTDALQWNITETRQKGTWKIETQM